MKMSKQESIRLNRIKVLLLLLLDRPMSKLDVQKFVFLLSRGREVLWSELQFEPYYMGQYSEILEHNLGELAQEGLIQEKPEEVLPLERGMKARQKIISLKEALSEKLGYSIEEVLKEIEDLRELREGLSEDEFLALIYYTFPEYAVNSEIMERIEEKRREIAMNLYLKGKVSLSKAAEIAGMDPQDFMSLLRRKGCGIPLEA